MAELDMTEELTAVGAEPRTGGGVLEGGVLPSQKLREARDQEWIGGKYRIPPENIQPASLDLRLGEQAFALNCSFLPDAQMTVEEKLQHLNLVQGEPLDLAKAPTLERGRPYLIPLMEELRLPDELRGRTNPKSSTGRLDIFTRVITDKTPHFDEIRHGYKGKLYLEVVPRSFSIKVCPGLSLNQLRLSKGHDVCDGIRTIYDLHESSPLLFDDGATPIPGDKLHVSNDGLFLTLRLRTGSGAAGYKAKKTSPLLDLSRIGEYEADQFWETLEPDRDGKLVLEPEEFYLLLSAERVSIPPNLAAEMTAYDPTAGELRTHYAGFFDPGFGFDPRGILLGANAVLEVRARDVPFMVEDGQRICKLTFERMLDTPDKLYSEEIGSSYQYQEITLSKHFKLHRNRPERQLVLPFAELGAWEEFMASQAG